MMPSKYREPPEVLIDAAMIMPAHSWIAVPPKRSPEKENEKLLVDDAKVPVTRSDGTEVIDQYWKGQAE